MLQTKTSKNNFVRITIDPELERAISAIQAEYPLLSRTESVKLILSRGLASSRPTLPQILGKLKQTNPIRQNLTEDQMFEEWQKFNAEM
jgi:hypothetical protein